MTKLLPILLLLLGGCFDYRAPEFKDESIAIEQAKKDARGGAPKMSVACRHYGEEIDWGYFDYVEPSKPMNCNFNEGFEHRVQKVWYGDDNETFKIENFVFTTTRTIVIKFEWTDESDAYEAWKQDRKANIFSESEAKRRFK